MQHGITLTVANVLLLLHYQDFFKDGIIEGKERGQKDAKFSRPETDKIQKTRYLCVLYYTCTVTHGTALFVCVIQVKLKISRTEF